MAVIANAVVVIMIIVVVVVMNMVAVMMFMVRRIAVTFRFAMTRSAVTRR